MLQVKVTDLYFAYPPALPGEQSDWTLRGVDLRAERGEFLSIMGPTDAGKSTLALALVGIVPQSTGGRIRGEVQVAGLNARQHPVAELARHASLVFQDPEMQFFNLSVETEVAFGLESLGLPRDEMSRRIAWALQLVGLKGLEGRSPLALSGGQKQRVALAAVLAMHPSVLVLDEPTASLDPQGQQEVFEVLDRLRRGGDMTVIMISNDSERVAQFSDRVAVLAQGRIVLEGSPREVFSKGQMLRELGLAVPQMLEVAQCLNRELGTEYAFLGLEEARVALSRGEART
jgi:energy-coupling factor transporter ATP-binding protein EcfA2